MPARKALLDDGAFSGDFLPGGSPTIPPTARATTPAAIAPNLFGSPQTVDQPAVRLPVGQVPGDYSTMAGGREGPTTPTPTNPAQPTPGTPTTPTQTAPTTTPPAAGGTTTLYDAVAGMYRTATGRDATPDEIYGWIRGKNVSNLAEIQQGIYGSQEAKAFAARQTAGGPARVPTGQPEPAPGAVSADAGRYSQQYGISADDASWVLGKIQQYGIDPQEIPYWMDFVQKHGSVAQTGESWLDDAMMRADSAAGVRNGTVQRRSEGGGTSPTGGGTSGYDNSPEMDRLLQDALGKLIGAGGMSGSGTDLYASLKKIIDAGGATPDLTAQIVKARDNEALAEQGLMSDARGELADRGLLSEPGVPQGAEISAVRRTAERVAPDFANAITDIHTKAMDQGQTSLLAALQMATGLSTDAAHNMLQAVTVGTNRQAAIANIALQTLDQNRQWQQFLMQHGLDRDRLAFEIDQGNWQTVLSFINAFLNGANIGGQGHV